MRLTVISVWNACAYSVYVSYSSTYNKTTHTHTVYILDSSLCHISSQSGFYTCTILYTRTHTRTDVEMRALCLPRVSALQLVECVCVCVASRSSPWRWPLALSLRVSTQRHLIGVTVRNVILPHQSNLQTGVRLWS